MIAEKLQVEPSNFGGWLVETVDGVAECADMLYVLPSAKTSSGKISDKLSYQSFSAKDNTPEFFEKIVADFSPDIIHIWGSELNHSYNMVRGVSNLNLQNKTVISLQGIVGECAKNYTVGLSDKIVNRWGLGDIARRTNIAKDRDGFASKGEYEIKALQSVGAVIGRTEWDKTTALSINPSLKYYYCGETLRDDFYNSDKWNYNNCNKHSIFVCQASYPLKGFHIALEMLSKLKDKYPDARIITTGKSYLPATLIGKLKQSSYQRHIRSLINKYNLADSMHSVGNLSAEGIAEELLKCNLILSPSTIENSPNSIGEAMMLGVPIVASDVGGVSSIMSEREGFLYSVLDTEKAVSIISEIFDNQGNEKADQAVNRATTQYARGVVITTLIDIYNEILGGKNE